MDRPRFRGVTVSQIAGISPVQLNTWVSRELLQTDYPDQPGPRRYSLCDLVRATLLADLTKLGVAPSSSLAQEAQRSVSQRTMLALGDAERISVTVNVPALWERVEQLLSQAVL